MSMPYDVTTLAYGNFYIRSGRFADWRYMPNSLGLVLPLPLAVEAATSNDQDALRFAVMLTFPPAVVPFDAAVQALGYGSERA